MKKKIPIISLILLILGMILITSGIFFVVINSSKKEKTETKENATTPAEQLEKLNVVDYIKESKFITEEYKDKNLFSFEYKEFIKIYLRSQITTKEKKFTQIGAQEITAIKLNDFKKDYKKLFNKDLTKEELKTIHEYTTEFQYVYKDETKDNTYTYSNKTECTDENIEECYVILADSDKEKKSSSINFKEVIKNDKNKITFKMTSSNKDEDIDELTYEFEFEKKEKQIIPISLTLKEIENKKTN